MKALSFLAAIAFLISAHPAPAAVRVVTTLPDLAWAAREIAGSHAEVSALLKGRENPHYVDTIPDFIRRVADAQVVCIVGLDLEIGWMPKVLARSGNAQVQPGGKGYCEAGKSVKVLEIPGGPVDRSMGDIHPFGNPHFWLSPRGMAESGEAIRDALTRVDPAHAEDYRKNHVALVKRLEALLTKNRARLTRALAGRTGPVLIEYHKEFTYFLVAHGIRSAGSIEEKPGIPPSAGRIGEVALAAKAQKLKIALGGDYAPLKVMSRFTELSGIPHVRVPTSILTEGSPRTYEELQEAIVAPIEKALANGVQ